MTQQITGVHIFEKLGEIQWEDELIAIQALSALTWKRHHGRIELYCNEAHLESLKKWGVDELYDKIDTQFLENIPHYVDKKEFWTYGKIFIPSQLEPPFILVDTDLWITGPLEFDFTKSFTAFHEESFEKEKDYKFYVNFDDFVPEKYIGQFDTTIKPTNVALLFINDKELVTEWNKTINEIIFAKRKTRLDRLQKTIFLEQWILPMLAKKMNREYNTFIPQIYESSDNHINHEDIWYPAVETWDDVLWEKFNKIKHIWGVKKRFNEDQVVQQIFEKVRIEFNTFSYENKMLSDFINNKSLFIVGVERTSDPSIKIVYFIPNLINNWQSNILYQRIKELYNYDQNVSINVCLVGKQEKINHVLKNKILYLIGTNNFHRIDCDVDSITKFLNENSFSVCQFDVSKTDKDFENLMSYVFSEKNITVIKSYDGENLITNTNKTKYINYPIKNNVLPYIPNVGYDFDKNVLPLHIGIQNKVLFRQDINSKNIIILGDIKNTDKQDYIIDLTNSIFSQNSLIQFHLLSYLDLNEDEVLISRLCKNTKIWLENVDFNDFIKLADLVIDIDHDSVVMNNEVISYGIPILIFGESNNKTDHVYYLTNILSKDISKIKNLLYSKIKRVIPTTKNEMGLSYFEFYNYLRNK